MSRVLVLMVAVCAAAGTEPINRPAFPADLKAALEKQSLTLENAPLAELLDSIAMASGVAFAAREMPAVKPVTVKEKSGLVALEQAAASHDALCFIARPYGILVTTRTKARDIAGAAIPADVAYETPPASPVARPPFPENAEALHGAPLTLNGNNEKLSSLIEMLSMATEATFAMERNAPIPYYTFGESPPKDIMQAIVDMTEGRICFVRRDYGILCASRETAGLYAGPAIPADLPYEEGNAPQEPEFPEVARRLLTHEPATFDFNLADMKDIAPAIERYGWVTLSAEDTPLVRKMTAEGRPRVYLKKGNFLQLMQAIVEAGGNSLKFVFKDSKTAVLTDNLLKGPS